MKNLSLAAAVLCGLVATIIPVSPGFAGTAAMPEVTDRAGDANLVNSNGQGPSEIGVSTAPASIDSADIRALWYETGYDERVEVAADGTRWVRNVAKALLLKIKTTAPAKPTFGPSVAFRYPALLNGTCALTFRALLEGSAPIVVSVGDAWVDASCFLREPLKESEFSLSMSGTVLTARFPFSAMGGLLAEGTIVAAHPTRRPDVRMIMGATGLPIVYGATIGEDFFVIDEAERGGTFVIGSDVPADVNCTEQPSYPDCS